MSHHLRAAGYEDTAPVFTRLVAGLRDIFR
jgi:hypothetical protein